LRFRLHAINRTKLLVSCYMIVINSESVKADAVMQSSADQSRSMSSSENSSSSTTISTMHPSGASSLDTWPSGETTTKLHHGAGNFVADAGLPSRCCSGGSGSSSGSSTSATEVGLCWLSSGGLAGTLAPKSTHEGWSGCGGGHHCWFGGNGGVGTNTSSSECHVW
jgi:hypothetical protein